MANAAEKTEVKKKPLPKGERLNWKPLKDAEPVVLTKEMLKGQPLSKHSNGTPDPNLLVP